MSEVNALQLRITDNATDAAKSLDRLASSLNKIRNALSNNLKLEQVAFGLGQFSTALAQSTSGDKVNKINAIAGALHKLANATERLKGAGVGFQQAMKAVDNLKGTIGANIPTPKKTGAGEVLQSTMAQGAGHTETVMDSSSVRRTREEVVALRNEMDRTIEISDHLGNTTVIRASDGAVIEQRTQEVRDLAQGMSEAATAANSMNDAMSESSSGGGKAYQFHASDIKDQVQAALDKVRELVETQTELDRVRQKVDELQNALAKDMASGKVSGSQVSARVADIQKWIAKAEKLESQRGPLNPEAQAAAQAKQMAEAQGVVETLTNAKTQADLLNMKIDAAKQKLATGIASGKMDQTQIATAAAQIQNMQGKLDGLRQKEQEAAEAASKHAGVMGQLESAVTKAQSAIEHAKTGLKNFAGAIIDAKGGLLGLLHGMMRMAKYRIFRSIIREISEGFKTGLENVRNYSKAINGSYAKDMAALDDSLLKMKNSLGAALVPAIQALMPYIQRAISGFITLINYVNQFFALIRGQKTWTKAVDVTAADFEETTKGAKGASSAINNLLADFDELNIIQSKGGGGGGGATAEDLSQYENMFTEMDVFDEKVRNIVGFLEDHLPAVKRLVEFIALKLLGFTNGGAALVLGIGNAYFEGRANAFNKVTLLDSLYSSVSDILVSAFGVAAIGFMLSPPGMKMQGALIGFGIGAAIGLIVATVGWIQGQEESAQVEETFAEYLQANLMKIALPAAVGAIGGFMIAGWQGALVGLTLGAAIGLVISTLNWKEKNDMMKSNVVDSNFSNTLGSQLGVVFDTVSGAAIGGLLGSFAGPEGTVIGILAGAGIGLVISQVELAKNQRDIDRAKLFGDIQIKAEDLVSGEVFGITASVRAKFNVLQTAGKDLVVADKELAEEAAKLNGIYKTTVGVKGWDELTDEERTSLLGSMGEFVEAAQRDFDAEKKAIQLSFGFGEMPEGAEENATFLLQWIGIKEDIVSKIGTRIGELLKSGTTEEFAKVVPELMTILNAVTGELDVSEASSRAGYALTDLREEFKNGEFTEKSVNTYVQGYSDLKEEYRTTFKDAKRRELTEAKKAYDFAYRVLNDEQFRKDLEATGFNTSIYTEEYLATAKRVVDSYGENGENIDAMVEQMMQRVFSDLDRQFYEGLAENYKLMAKGSTWIDVQSMLGKDQISKITIDDATLREIQLGTEYGMKQLNELIIRILTHENILGGNARSNLEAIAAQDPMALFGILLNSRSGQAVLNTIFKQSGFSTGGNLSGMQYISQLFSGGWRSSDKETYTRSLEAATTDAAKTWAGQSSTGLFEFILGAYGLDEKQLNNEIWNGPRGNEIIGTIAYNAIKGVMEATWGEGSSAGIMQYIGTNPESMYDFIQIPAVRQAVEEILSNFGIVHPEMSYDDLIMRYLTSGGYVPNNQGQVSPPEYSEGDTSGSTGGNGDENADATTAMNRAANAIEGLKDTGFNVTLNLVPTPMLARVVDRSIRMAGGAPVLTNG